MIELGIASGPAPTASPQVPPTPRVNAIRSLGSSDELRGAIRCDRPGGYHALASYSCSPHSVLCAGATPEEIASTHGMDVKAVERFEAPVR